MDRGQRCARKTAAAKRETKTPNKTLGQKKSGLTPKPKNSYGTQKNYQENAMYTQNPTQPMSHGEPTTSSHASASNVAVTAPGQVRVIKRNGNVVAYDPSKVSVAMTKAFLAVEGGNAAASARVHE